VGREYQEAEMGRKREARHTERQTQQQGIDESRLE
jgi:hypothetical protein